MAKAAEYKKKLVEDMVKLMRQHSMVGVVDMNNLPAPQLQSMRAELRGKISLFMTKKRLMKIALEKIKNEKKNIDGLEKCLEGMPALIFANENPFKLNRILQKSKTSAPAKAGQIAPNDIIVSKGPTPFAPGPIISELSGAGLKVGVEGGKVAVKEDTVIARKGEKINPKVAGILTRLDIKPMQVGLGMVAAYENEIIYQRDILEIDEKAFNEKVSLAAAQAYNFAFNIAYATKDNINLLLSAAFNDAKALGVSQKILDEGIIEQLLGKAEMEMLSLKKNANIETAAHEIKEESKPKEEPEPEVKEEPKKEEPKAEKKKIKSHIQEKIEKKEEKALEEEKKIIEEEKKLEEEKPKEAPAEKEIQEAVKKEEEKKLEKERIEKEKELEKVEKQKEGIKKAEEKREEPKPEEGVDKKVKAMVEKTKKFAEGKEETAADILKEVKKEEEEKKIQQQKEKPEKREDKEVPSAHELKKQKEDRKKPENKEDKGRKEVEELTKELLKKGTLRKNKQY